MSRDQFNPGRLVQLAVEALERYGVRTTVTSKTLGPAANAAADLLRALGVDPASVPEMMGAPPRCRDCGEVMGVLGVIDHVPGCGRSYSRR